MSELTTHEVLVRGRNLLDREGWVQRDYGFDGGPHCAMSAIAGSGNGAALRALAVAIGCPATTAIGRWNDAPGRTKEEVLAAFARAIAATAPAPDFASIGVPEVVAA